MSATRFDLKRAEQAGREICLKLRQVGIDVYVHGEAAKKPVQGLLEKAFIGLEINRERVYLRFYTDVSEPDLTDIQTLYYECLNELYHEDSEKIQQGKLKEEYRRISVGERQSGPPSYVTSAYLFNEAEFVRYCNFLDNFINEVDEMKQNQCSKNKEAFLANNAEFESNLQGIIIACQDEFDRLVNQPSSKTHYYGYRATKKIKQYKEELDKVLDADDPLEALKDIYKKVEKDFGRASRASQILFIAAIAFIFITVAAIMIAFPHIFALTFGSAAAIVLGGVVTAIAGFLGGLTGSSSKDVEADSFGRILTSAKRNFPTLFNPAPEAIQTTPEPTTPTPSAS